MTAVISHNPINFLKKEFEDYKKLFRSIPALVVSFFVVSVIITNLMAGEVSKLPAVQELTQDARDILNDVKVLIHNQAQGE